MSVQAFKDAYVEVDGTDFSGFVKQCTLTYSAEALDKTGVGDTTRSRIGGLKDWTLDLEFYQDFDALSVDAVVFPLIGSSTFTFAIRPSTTAASSTNPSYNGTCYLESYTPLAGNVGELMMTPLRILAGGDLSRTTT